MDTVDQTVAILLLFALIAIISLLLRYMHYRETMALIDKGMFPPEQPQKQNRNMLRWGIILTFVSCPWTVMFVALFLFSGSFTSMNNLVAPGIFLGLMPFCFGLALICISRIERKEIGSASVRYEEREPVH